VVPAPTFHEAHVEQHAGIRREETHDADAHGGPELAPDDLAVDLGAGEKRQHDRAKPGEEVHPLGDLEPDHIAGESSDHDLDERHRHGKPDRNEGGKKRQSDPDRRREPNVLHARVLRSTGREACG
jgi:hypothetical protein